MHLSMGTYVLGRRLAYEQPEKVSIGAVHACWRINHWFLYDARSKLRRSLIFCSITL